MRLFVAIDLTAELKAALAELQNSLRRLWLGAPIRWVDPAGIHLTLKFLGEVGADRLEAIFAALERGTAGVEPFELKIGGLGFFPSGRRTRVIWVGVNEATGRLAKLQRQVEAGLEPLGFAPENREFVPHLTLGRLKTPTSLLPPDASLADRPLGRMPVREVVLMESRLSPTGATYRPVRVFPLEPVGTCRSRVDGSGGRML
ncbi:MAG: RNA 2',3'-cyclic phosphodiesterase [Chloroflexota bacterium]